MHKANDFSTAQRSAGNQTLLKPIFWMLFVLLCALQLGAVPAHAQAENPLRPMDNTSPRATLLGFIDFMNQGFVTGVGPLASAITSSTPYLTSEQMASIHHSIRLQESAQRALDVSELPPAILHETSRRLAIQLKEVLDRIALPPLESIPDGPAMTKAEFKRWTLPNTEIQIAQVKTGPRAGEYLFTPETLSRLPEFYAKVMHLPYQPGASVGWYDFSTYSPVGVAILLRRIVPTHWLLDRPEQRTRTLFLDQPAWRWLGMLFVLGIGFAVIRGFFRLSAYWAGRTESAGQWAALLRPLSIVLVMPMAAVLLAEALRVSGILYEVATRSLWTVFFLALAWLVWVAGGVVAESVISVEKQRRSSIDSQLIRLMLRLLTMIVMIAILVKGGDRIGLPAYSVFAGLGVGGLAVALAAQQTLANLLGSLIIMFEKPFAIGHCIKLQNFEGTVESVGFRSTRIRTTCNSLVTIPSSQLVNSPIDNLALRHYRQVRTMLNLSHDTKFSEIEAFLDHIKHILLTHPDTHKDNIQAVLYDIGPNSFNILLNFFVTVPDIAAELKQRQQILLDILRWAETRGIRFATPPNA